MRRPKRVARRIRVGYDLVQMSDASHPEPDELPKRLAPLARRLAALSAEERRAVLDAASRVDARPTASWASIDNATGIVNLGGNALDDTAQLYDG